MRGLLIFLTAALLFLTVCSPEVQGTFTRQPSFPLGSDWHSRPEKLPGQVIVKFKYGLGTEPATAASGRLQIVKQLVRESGVVSEAQDIIAFVDRPPTGKLSDIAPRRGLDRIFVLKFDPATDTDDIIEKLERSGRVEYAEPNYPVRLGGQTIHQPVDDPNFLEQWALSNPGFNVDGFGATKGDDIAATVAWQITTGSPNVLVAVVDTGIDVNHPDLAQNIYTNAGPPPTNGFNVADNNSNVSDVVGHGTQMAGIIAAVSNNGVGVAGTCQCKVLPVKFFTQSQSDPSQVLGTVADAAKGIIYAVGAGADIINASWEASPSTGELKALREACVAANDANVLMVCIAGNDGFDNDVTPVYPGHYQLPNQIVVAASDYNDNIWSTATSIQSGYGAGTVQLGAPGVWILSTQARGTCALCTSSATPSDWYTYSNGTSASAAFVSATAALVKSQFPEASAQVMRRRILEGVDPKIGLQGFVSTGGRLNAYKALSIQLSVTPPVLSKVKYKVNRQSLLLYGLEFQQGAHVIVGDTVYPVNLAPDGTSPMTASIPAAALPAGTTTSIVFRNPDGGTSQPLSLTR